MEKSFKIFFIIVALLTMQSCTTATYSVTTTQQDSYYGPSCPNPTYVATMSKTATKYNQKSLTLEQLLQDARKSYGQDITIQNVRWDTKNKSEKESVIYDVIKCK